MAKNETQCRVAWEYAHQCRLEKALAEQEQRAEERRLMDAEDVLGGLMRVELIREARNREVMGKMDIESVAFAVVCKQMLEQQQKKIAEEKLEHENVLRQRAQEEEESRLRLERVAADKKLNEEKIDLDKQEQSRRSSGRVGDSSISSKPQNTTDAKPQVSGGGGSGGGRKKAVGGSLSERGGSGWGGSVPKAIEKKPKKETIGGNTTKQLHGEIDSQHHPTHSANASAAKESYSDTAADINSTRVTESACQTSSEMLSTIEKIVHDSVIRSKLPIQFKSVFVAENKSTPPERSAAPQSPGLYEFAMSVRDKQHHELIHTALRAWRRNMQLDDRKGMDWNQATKRQLKPHYKQALTSQNAANNCSNDFSVSDVVEDHSSLHQIQRQSHGEKKQRELKMAVEGLSDISFIKNYPNLIVLHLNVNRITNLDSFVGVATMLQELNLKDNILTCIKGITGLKSLRVLNLEANQLTDLSPLEKLPNLVYLCANMNRLTSVPILSCPKLQKLELYHNRISDFSQNSLKHLTSLTYLDLGRNKLSHVSGEALSQCQLLSHLVLSQNQITEAPNPLHLPNLRRLWLSRNQLCDLNAWTRSDVNEAVGNDSWPVFLPMLEQLYLQDNTITCVESNCMASSPFLTEVDLSFNSVRSLQNLSGILECPLLRILQLQDNHINGDAVAMYYIKSLLPDLTELSGQTIDPLLPASPPDEECLRGGEMHMQRKICIHKFSGWINFKTSSSSQNQKMTFPAVPFWKRRSKHVKELIHFISGLITEQNIARTFDRASSTQSESGGIKLTTQQTDLVDVLQAHTHLLLLWNSELHASTEHIIAIRSPPSHESDIAADNPQRSNMQAEYCSPRRESKEAQSVKSARQAHGALRIQAWTRGWITRNKLKKILSSAFYFDDELDEMLGGGDPFAEYEGFLSKTAPELEDDWLKPRIDGSAAYIDRISHRDDHGTAITSAGSDGSSFVYGDHRRRRSKHNLPSSADAAEQLRERQPRTPTGSNERSSPRAQLTSMYRNDWECTRSSQGRELHDAGVYINRPHSNSARFLHESETAETVESSRPASRSSNLSGTSSRFGLGNYDMEEDADMLLHTARSRVSNVSEQAAEWGISNPTVVETMLKRNKRLKYVNSVDIFMALCVLVILC